jgi:Tfp pilus assembly protein PilN
LTVNLEAGVLEARGRVGLQLSAERIRAVVVTGWARQDARAVEVPFDPEHPEDAIYALRPLVGTPRRIAVAVDLALLRTKRITLPALSAAERRNILRLEPDRFFAVRGEEIVPAVRADDELVFAATASALDRWVSAIEQLAPVDAIEPTPVALARALETAAIIDATILFDGGDAGFAVAEIRDSRVMRARRVFGTAAQVAETLVADGYPLRGAPVYLDTQTEERRSELAVLWPSEPLPAVGPSRGTVVAGPFAAAVGAVMAIDTPPAVAETLVSPAHGTVIARRRTRALATAIVTCAAAFVFALSSLDGRRDRTQQVLDASTADLNTRAAPALAMQTELASLSRRTQAMRAIDLERPDPLRVMRALSAALPAGAFVRQIRGAGHDWQVDGYAPNASAVLTALGASTDFHDVHFLSATTREQIANHPYESFALAFRYTTAP